MSKTKISGILQGTRLATLSILGISDRPGIAASLMQALGDAHVNVQFIVQCIDGQRQDHILACVDLDDLSRAEPLARAAADSIGAQSVEISERTSTISIFGPDFRVRPGIAAEMFGALARRDINILAISTSISTVSCLIHEECLEAAVEALEQVFELP